VSSQQDQAGGREVFRSPGSAILWWAWVVIAVAALADVAVEGSGRSAAIAAVLVAAVTGVMYGCALRPRVVADAGGITVENPLRDHRVRWGSVAKVDAVNALRVHCAAAPGASKGTIVHSWALQSSPRSARAAQLRASRRAQQRARREAQQRPGGYGRHPAQAGQAPRPGAAETAAQRLDERARREREAGAAGGPPETRWAWASIAAMAVPLAALIVVALA
jgi:PH (Pleckstrin Homology) domain-containing protein